MMRCTECDCVISPAHTVRHASTAYCKDRVKRKHLATTGYIRTGDDLVINALQSGAVPGEMLPIGYNYYVPQWVINAAKLYHKNKSYAGMNFAEFVARMADQGRTE